MTYSELVELIKDYVQSDETSFVDNIPNFVKLAEERIYRYVEVPGLRAEDVSISTAAANRSITVPSDFISSESLEILVSGSWVHLMPKAVNFLSEAFPSNSGTGTPAYYAQFDNTTIRLAPTPSAIFSLRLTYVQKPASIVTAETNWIGDNAEQALLYGSLVEAYTYLKGEPDLLSLYDQRFMEAVGQAKLVGDGKTRTDDWRNEPPLAR